VCSNLAGGGGDSLDKPAQPEHFMDGLQTKKRSFVMATCIALLQYTDQGIRNVKVTTKRAAAAGGELDSLSA
jgi:hypothetical protein